MGVEIVQKSKKNKSLIAEWYYQMLTKARSKNQISQ